MSESTKLEKIYQKLHDLKKVADEDVKINKSTLETQFDSSTKIIKWLNFRIDWIQVSQSLEHKKKLAWRTAYEYYKTEYNIKLGTADEYRLMIETDPAYSTLLLECNATKEVILYIESVIDALKARGYNVTALSKYMMWTGGHRD